MPLRSLRASRLLAAVLLAWVLVTPAARASEPGFAADAPLRTSFSEALPVAPHPGPAPEAAEDSTPEGTRLPGMSGMPMEPPSGEKDPLKASTWAAHGGLALLPLGTVWTATRVGGDTRLGATASEAAAGVLLGSLPGRLLFIRPTSPNGRWTEIEVAAFGAGLVLTPPAAALGTWGLGELAFGASRHPRDAYFGALGGAAAGALLGVAVHGLLGWLAEPSLRGGTLRELIALGLIGSGATVGYQWAGGGPRNATR